MDKKTQLVAVYGSLKEGFGNHRLLANKDSKKLGVTVTPPKFTMYGLGGFPGVVKGGDTAITVEVYEVTERVRENLDGLEGYRGPGKHNFYEPLEIDTEFGKANMYILAQPEQYKNRPEIEDGVWQETWKRHL